MYVPADVCILMCMYMHVYVLICICQELHLQNVLKIRGLERERDTLLHRERTADQHTSPELELGHCF